MAMTKTYVCGRILEDNPDVAAMRIRDMHKEYIGRLVILEAFPGWLEYRLEITRGEERDI